MNQNKMVAFLMASIVAIGIVAMAMPVLGDSEDMAKEGEKPAVVIPEPSSLEPEPKKPEELDESKPKVRKLDPRFNPVFREVVIVYFNEMPASLENFASTYGVTLIFVKEDIKMAAFETEPIGKPGETSQRTLEFIEEVSKNSCVEKAYKDRSMFVYSDEVFIMPHGQEKIVERFDEVYIPADLELFIHDNVFVEFWRLPPSLDEFASTYGATLKSVDELSAIFETDDVPGFVKKISTDPYVMYCTPVKKRDLDESEPEVREPDPRFNPVFRDAVIVYFNEMPASLEEFASDYSVKLIFVKEEIKMAAFETEPISMPMETSQRTLDFIEEVSKDLCVEKAYEDGFMFVDTKKLYTPEPKIIYPEDFDREGAEYIPNEVIVGFWRLPPSLEEFASRYGAKLKNFDKANEFLLFAVFETDDATGFIKKISTDPYVDSCGPHGVVRGSYTPNDPKKISTDPYVQPAELDSIGYIAIHQTAQNGISNEVQRKYNVQKQGNNGKATRVSRTTAKELPVVHKKIPAVKVMNISVCRGGALYKYPQKIRR